MKHYHLVGVGGIGLSGVARLLLQAGCRVSGSDEGDVDHLQPLEVEGLKLYRHHDAKFVAPDVSEVVYSVAVPENNPELVEARKRGLRLSKYAQMVGHLMKDKRGLCVAGAHGKTTTSAMLAWILKCEGRDPSFIIGADVPQLGGSSHSGRQDFVLESCEYDRSFHNYYPEQAIITNVDVDHLDYYANIREIQDSFRQFRDQVKGSVYMNGDDAYSQKLITSEQITYGFDNSNQVYIQPCGLRQALVWREGQEFLKLQLLVPGLHNLLNAAAASLVAYDLGCSRAVIEESMGEFQGASRRFQILHQEADFVIVDDYAHHPVEIKAVLQAAAENWPGYRRVVVFQPHQHTRTRFLMDSFAWVLSQAEMSLLPDIYFVRDSERHQQEVSSRDLVRAIRSHRGEAKYVANIEMVPELIESYRDSPTVVLLLGAGDIWKLGTRLCA